MKLLVTVKEVAQPEDDFQLSGMGIDEKYLEYDLNEWDDYAIEEAVQLKEESDDDVEVVTVTIGPERSEETIRMALAKGADRAVRVWDSSLENTEILDPHVKAEILSNVVEEEEPDIIFSGVQADDDSLAATGVSLAELIDYEWAAVVNKFELNSDGSSAEVHRELEGGVEEITDVEMPAVMTIQTGINEPRYASLRGIRQAQSKEIAEKSLDDIGVDPSEIETPIKMTDMYEPESESDTQMIDGDESEVASRLREIFEDKGVVG